MILSKPDAQFALIHDMTVQDGNRLNISWLCEMAGVSRSGYYRWLAAKDTRDKRDKDDRRDFEYILAAYRKRGYAKGARGIHMTMLRFTPPVLMNLKKIRRLMNKYDLHCSIRHANPYKKLLQESHAEKVPDNTVNREFKKYGPRTVLLTDITYIRKPYEDGFVYLSVIIDAVTMEILAYALSDNLKLDFVLLTVQRLLNDHGKELQTGVLLHSDQGVHYTSIAYEELLKNADLRQSMSRRGNCWDNAPQESFFGHMKDEIDISHCSCYDDIEKIIMDWIDYYNNERYQWNLAKLAPSEYYVYCMTGVYPLGGSAPKPPEFIALVSKEGIAAFEDNAENKTKEKDET